ncbi:hypothetical protein [Rhizobium sp. BK251]|uniref:hypothetical protein n=1 Tax=Rhizobium sp. BK251 TaxID=2512125 RepID=UPI00104A5F60|nr:hypothetical protein [Rhizobium sp. BK251]TCL74627.1 hypothetical protein EV286_102188 [Rhizobium sp. BK251]
MSKLRTILATGLVALTMAGASIAFSTPAEAHGGGGGHGGGGHGGGFGGGHFGGGHFGGGHFGGGRFGDHGDFRGRPIFFAHGHRFHDRFDRFPFFLGNDDDDPFPYSYAYYPYYDNCHPGWSRDRAGHLHRVEICE